MYVQLHAEIQKKEKTLWYENGLRPSYSNRLTIQS